MKTSTNSSNESIHPIVRNMPIIASNTQDMVDFLIKGKEVKPEFRSLLAANYSYDQKWGITEQEIDIVVNAINDIEKRLITITPHFGDRVIAVGPKKTYDTGRIDHPLFGKTEFSVITQPMVPFVDPKTLNMDFSGGYFIPCNLSELEYVGEDITDFKVWGRWGAQQNGAVYFKAKVNVWRYENEIVY